ncbi:isoamylase 1, chloroplastic-like isoform X1 [Vigna radiata var. radiata]|uniref:Isoamylase 1, chloroplastic-like isoform X1 n=1 Tax=Vigna radiata var. radiata TaxID=3916 RepID=A0A3Q0EPW2_VIGRR|nr:isoamylase 1, chloroplastic-like isoform X1 [Vigna radiata var. radiata]
MIIPFVFITAKGLEEGEFVSPLVKKLRKRQMQNFFLSLMVSQGVPIIYMGDEYGHTKGGNNNTYCHDNYLNYFQWDKKEESSLDFFRFCCLVTKFHQECESMGLDDFPTSKRLQWHGHFPGMPDWSETSRFVAFTMVGKGLSKDVKARKLALQHWLETIDPRHRYGHNLQFIM